MWISFRTLCVLQRCSYTVGCVLIRRLESTWRGRTPSNPLFHSPEVSLSHTSVPGVNERHVLNTTATKANVKKSASKSRSASKDVESHLSKTVSITHLMNIPKKLLTRKRTLTDSLYLVDEVVASQIMDRIGADLTLENSVILEALPGLGLLSEKLLHAGVQYLHLFEPSSQFRSHLNHLQRQYPGRVKVVPTDIYLMGKLAYQDRMDNGNRVENLLSAFPKSNWEDDSVLKVVGTLPSLAFINYLILSIALQRGFMMHFRPEFYFMMSAHTYEHLTATGEKGYIFYRSISVLFQLFFDHILIEKLPRESFLPWLTEKSGSGKRQPSQVLMLDTSVIYLVKIVPKRNLYEIMPPENIQQLWYFVRQHFLSRRGKVISTLENWIPDCGIRLILEDFNIFTEFGDLTPQQVLHLFQLFSSWPEYKDCSFLESLETLQVKMEGNDYVEKVPEVTNDSDGDGDEDEVEER